MNGTDFDFVLESTLIQYTEYVYNDAKLSDVQRKECLENIEQIKKSLEARKKLVKKLIEYDKKQEYYLNQLPSNISIKNKDFLQIINK